jgi:hypothetical protein
MLGDTLVKKQSDGTWVFRVPISADNLVPSVDIDEYGMWVCAVIEHKELRDDGRAIPVDAENISLRDLLTGISKGQRDFGMRDHPS